MTTKTLEQQIAELRKVVKLQKEFKLPLVEQALGIIDSLQIELHTLKAETSAERFCFQNWKSEKTTLENMNKSLEGAIEIVQDELAEVKAENKSWQEMVDSTNQTNQAMSRMLDELQAENEKVKEKLKIAQNYLQKKFNEKLKDLITE